MKTIADLNALIPTLCDLIKNNDHEIGDTYYDRDEDDSVCRYSEYESNGVFYEKDGWYIEISYKCAGNWSHYSGDYLAPPSSYLHSAWGEVTEIIASHYDEDTDEETEFSDDDLKELWNALDAELENIK